MGRLIDADELKEKFSMECSRECFRCQYKVDRRNEKGFQYEDCQFFDEIPTAYDKQAVLCQIKYIMDKAEKDRNMEEYERARVYYSIVEKGGLQ